MPAEPGFRCGTCGRWHDALPFSYHAMAPVQWRPELEDDEASELAEDQCIIEGEHFFVRALIRLPVLDADQDFEWGVWVSLSEENFGRMTELWSTEGREAERPYFGWLSSELPAYEEATLLLKTEVHTPARGLASAGRT